ncbi:hypothetical protein ACSNOI_20410 [Actinomadura kijaniata]|uniref:hypothetical protein n=1 Tax=Actinomadura kijaniata TaxID=46161 RepID=UPI003F1A704F
MIRIRLMGLPDHVTAVLAHLRQTLDVVEVSDLYPCRGESRNVRVYLTAQPPATPTADGG